MQVLFIGILGHLSALPKARIFRHILDEILEISDLRHGSVLLNFCTHILAWRVSSNVKSYKCPPPGAAQHQTDKNDGGKARWGHILEFPELWGKAAARTESEFRDSLLDGFSSHCLLRSMFHHSNKLWLSEEWSDCVQRLFSL